MFHLMDGYLDEVQELIQEQFLKTITLKKGISRAKDVEVLGSEIQLVNNPNNVVKAKLKKSKSETSRCGRVMVGNWKDKRKVITILNRHTSGIIMVLNHHGQKSRKPSIFAKYCLSYSKALSRIDRMDQYLFKFCTVESNPLLQEDRVPYY